MLLVAQVVTVNRTTSPSLTDCRVANVAENKIGYINSSDQESKGGHVFATYQSNSKDFHKLQIAIASRKHILSQTALKVLMKRRNELVTSSSSSFLIICLSF
jgi:N-formylglutamate amidohydrolase